MEESIEEKQLFLRTEIIMNGYDANDFSIFLANLKEEEKIDLEYWSLEEVKNAVETYKKLKLIEKQKESQITPGEDKTDQNIDKNKKKFQLLKPQKRRQSSAQPKRKIERSQGRRGRHTDRRGRDLDHTKKV